MKREWIKYEEGIYEESADHKDGITKEYNGIRKRNRSRRWKHTKKKTIMKRIKEADEGIEEEYEKEKFKIDKEPRQKWQMIDEAKQPGETKLATTKLHNCSLHARVSSVNSLH